MAKRFNQGIRSRKILYLLKDENIIYDEVGDGTSKDKTSRTGLSEKTEMIKNKTFNLPVKQIILEKFEIDLLEQQRSYKITFSTPKSLSLSDLTQDIQTYKIKRSLSAPTVCNVLGSTSEILVTSCISPSIVAEQNIENDCSLLQEDLTDCESENEYGNIDEGRKRRHVAKKSEWKKLKAQRKRLRGEEYLGYSKPRNQKMQQDQTRPAKQLGETCVSEFCRKSKFRGCSTFDNDSRISIHTYFWKKLNWDERKIYVRGLVNHTTTNQKTKGTEHSRRDGTYGYFLPNNAKEKIQVCKQMFLNTLSLKSTTVQIWVKNNNFNLNEENDNASGSGIRQNSKILVLNDYLKRIPKLPSHYARKETRKLYLEPIYRTVTDVYNAYKQHCSNIDSPAVSRYTFDKAFFKNNLALYTLKKDMCDTCVGHQVGNIDEHLYQEHLIKKNRAREEKDKDKHDAESGQCIVLTMDLESVKVCPYSTASALYFKTKLTCHNFTIFNVSSRHCTCYWFTETAADLTASTFASFVIDYLERHCLAKIPIIIYSDGCTYQNRNVIMANALLNFSIKHQVSVIQKFLERGHTQMECDSVHSAIERKLANRVIHLPCDYISATLEARVSNPYEVLHVDHNFVKNYADATTWIYTTIRPGRKAGDPTVTDLRAIRYNYEQNVIDVKLHFDQDWYALPQRPKRCNPDVSYSSLHTNMIPITASKYKHLQELKQVLPIECHNFYDSLPHL